MPLSSGRRYFQTPLLPSQPNWRGLEMDLTGSAFFAKAFASAPPKALSLLLNTISSSHNAEAIKFAIASMRLGMAEDFTANEIIEINRLLTSFNFDITIPATRDSSLISLTSTLDANIRNSVEPQIVTSRTRLLIDNLKEGSFSKMPWGIWQPQTSKITAKTLGEVYLARLSFIPSSLLATILTIELDVNGVIIYRKPVQLLSLSGELLTESFPFFISQSFLDYGGILYISATNRIELRNVSLYLVRLSTGL